jgi:uncharacterized membrane protein (DUF373 family)
MSTSKNDSRYSQQFILKSERFMFLINSAVIVAIAIVLLFSIGLLFFDIYCMIRDRYAMGIGTVLGSLLILWVLMELFENQVAHLKGERIDVSVFIVVVLVAFIRKLMVASLDTKHIEVAYFPLATIFVLSVVYIVIRIIDKKYCQ